MVPLHRSKGVFSIFADESKDISNQEQLVLILHYVHKNERFLTYLKAEPFNTESLSEYTIAILKV